MSVNIDKPHLWKQDIAQSVDMYNSWFMNFAPEAFRSTRLKTTDDVEVALSLTSNMTDINPVVLMDNPGILPALRMSACPPLAVDRLIGLSGVPSHLVKRLEVERKLPARMSASSLERELEKIVAIVQKMVDRDIFTWLASDEHPLPEEIRRAATIVADRLCGAVANPIIRNAQEKRQLSAIKAWLEQNGYKQSSKESSFLPTSMDAGTFAFHLNITARHENGVKDINIPIDVVIMPKNARVGDFPILFEAKSAGDFTNTNKRRKEEATKISQLRFTFGEMVRFNLFLCGYFDSGYLGYEAAEGIDWVWEHRIDDLAFLGI